MNLSNFLLVLLISLSSTIYAQDIETKTVFFDENPTGKINRVPLKNSQDRVVGYFLHKKLPNGTTEIGVNYEPIRSSGVRLELKKQGKTIYIEDNTENGPSPLMNIINQESKTLHSEEFKIDSEAEDEDWIIFVLAVAYCCVEIEVSHDENEGYSSTITFDCDCVTLNLSGLSVTTGDGQQFNAVDEIVLTAI